MTYGPVLVVGPHVRLWPCVVVRLVVRVQRMIRVEEYNPSWPQRFEALKRHYTETFEQAGVAVVAIEHVGSTAVPHLAAKPFIDLDIVVRDTDVPAATAAMTTLGFRPLGELGIPQRWAFKSPSGFEDTNTYVIVEGSLSLRNHLAVRDALRGDEGLRERYAQVKREVGAQVGSIEEYGQGKDAMVQEILAAAGLSTSERASIGSNQVPSREEVPR